VTVTEAGCVPVVAGACDHGAAGASGYASIASKFDYGEDNIPKKVTDPLQRGITPIVATSAAPATPHRPPSSPDSTRRRSRARSSTGRRSTPSVAP